MYPSQSDGENMRGLLVLPVMGLIVPVRVLYDKYHAADTRDFELMKLCVLTSRIKNRIKEIERNDTDLDHVAVLGYN